MSDNLIVVGMRVRRRTDGITGKVVTLVKDPPANGAPLPLMWPGDVEIRLEQPLNTSCVSAQRGFWERWEHIDDRGEPVRLRSHDDNVAVAMRHGTVTQVYACNLVTIALTLAGVEVRHVIPSLHIDRGIEMCFREPFTTGSQRPNDGWQVFGWEGDARSIVALLYALARCVNPNGIAQAIRETR
jgi:hypothetical protein